MHVEFSELLELILKKDLAGLQMLLALGLNPNVHDADGRPLLQWAVQEGDAAIMRCLIDHGAQIDARDSLGFTALATAIHEDEDGQAGKTALLLERGASPNTRIPSDAGRSILHSAASWGRFGIIKLLLQRKDVDLNLRDNEGRTPLAFAREEGSAEIIEYLVRHGARD